MAEATSTLEEVRQALQDLINAEGFEIPGLDKETALDYYVEEKYKNELSALDNDQEARDKEKKRLKDRCKEIMSDFFDYCIMQIKLKFQAIKEGCQQLAESIQSAISSQMIPSVITTGAATSAANPAYTAMEAKQKKNNFKTMLKNLALMFADLLHAIILVCFPIPAMVLALLETLTTTKQLIETIPG